MGLSAPVIALGAWAKPEPERFACVEPSAILSIDRSPSFHHLFGVFIVTTIGLAEFVGKRNYSRLKMRDATLESE
jgi:hypothetical protein